jgi:Ca2+-binding RTX toxin-like protein
MPKGGKGGNGVIKGNRKDNVLTGTSQADILRGLDGDDQLFGLDGNDTLEGGNGSDTLDGGSGDDLVLGGAGFDIAVFSGARDEYTAWQAGDGAIIISGPDGTDTFLDVESFVFQDIAQSATEVLLPRLPNLSVSGFAVDDLSLAPSDVATAIWTVGSDGIIDAMDSNTALLIASAPDLSSVLHTLDAFDISVLETGATATFQASFDTTRLAPGTYYIAAIADADQTLPEEDETDNLTGWIQIEVEEPVANLSLDTLALGPQSMFDLTEGALLDLSAEVSNTGNTGNGQFLLVTVLSEDAVYSEDDEVVSVLTAFLEPGQAEVYDQTVPIDQNIAPGEYHVISAIQWIVGGPEDESDNVYVLPETVTFIGGTITGTQGQDIIAGTEASEDIVLLGGDDILFASDGFDYAFGGLGTDVAIFSDRPEGIELVQTYDFSTGQVLAQVNSADWTQPYTWQTILQNFEHVVGTDFDDFFYIGELEIAEVEAGGGNDQILGSVFSETIFAGDGDDMIGGLDGDDVIFTGDGADQVYVGRYDDNGTTVGDGMDVVVDFDPLQDTLWLEIPYDVEVPDLLAFVSSAPEGALVSYADDSAVLLLEVDAASLNEGNLLLFEDLPGGVLL